MPEITDLSGLQDLLNQHNSVLIEISGKIGSIESSLGNIQHELLGNGQPGRIQKLEAVVQEYPMSDEKYKTLEHKTDQAYKFVVRTKFIGKIGAWLLGIAASLGASTELITCLQHFK